LLERQSAAFPSRAIKTQGCADGDNASVIARPFIWRQRRTDLLAQSFLDAPDAATAESVAHSSDYRR